MKYYWLYWGYFTAFVGFIVSVICLFVGCNNQAERPPDRAVVSETGKELKIVHIDGCEYFEFFSHYSFYIHKGNCTNH